MQSLRQNWTPPESWSGYATWSIWLYNPNEEAEKKSFQDLFIKERHVISALVHNIRHSYYRQTFQLHCNHSLSRSHSPTSTAFPSIHFINNSCVFFLLSLPPNHIIRMRALYSWFSSSATSLFASAQSFAQKFRTRWNCSW